MFIKMIKKILRPEDIVAIVYIVAFFIIIVILRSKPIQVPVFIWNKYGFTIPLTVIIILICFNIFVSGSVSIIKKNKRINFWLFSKNNKFNYSGNLFIKVLSILRDWSPFMIGMLMYGNLRDLVHFINPNDVDRLLIKIDNFLCFGSTPSLWTEWLVNPVLTNIMNISYMSYFAIIPAVGFIFYLLRYYDVKYYIYFRTYILAILLACLFGYIGYNLFPAVGPQYTLASLYTVDLSGNVHKTVSEVIDLLRVSRDCFPSLHVTHIHLGLIFTYKYYKKFFFVVLPFSISLYIATIYLRYHYLIDLIPGFLLAYFCFYLAKKINNWWGLIPERKC